MVTGSQVLEFLKQAAKVNSNNDECASILQLRYIDNQHNEFMLDFFQTFSMVLASLVQLSVEKELISSKNLISGALTSDVLIQLFESIMTSLEEQRHNFLLTRNSYIFGIYYIFYYYINNIFCKIVADNFYIDRKKQADVIYLLLHSNDRTRIDQPLLAVCNDIALKLQPSETSFTLPFSQIIDSIFLQNEAFHICQIIGIKGSGKSELIFQISQNKTVQKDWNFIQPLVTIVNSDIVLNAYLDELKQGLNTSKRKGLLLVFDDFDFLDFLLQRKICAFLRTLYDQSAKFNTKVLVLLSRRANNGLYDAQGPICENVTSILFLNPFSLSEIRKFCEINFLSISPLKLFSQTHGFPLLLQSFAFRKEFSLDQIQYEDLFFSLFHISGVESYNLCEELKSILISRFFKMSDFMQLDRSLIPSKLPAIQNNSSFHLLSENGILQPISIYHWLTPTLKPLSIFNFYVPIFVRFLVKKILPQEQFTRLSEKRVQYYYNLFVDEQLPAVRAVYLLEITYHLLTLNVPDWKKRIKILIDKNDFLLSEYLILFRGDQELLDLLVFANMQD